MGVMHVSSSKDITVEDYIDEFLNGFEPPTPVLFRFMIRICRSSELLPRSTAKYIDLAELYWFGYGVSDEQINVASTEIMSLQKISNDYLCHELRIDWQYVPLNVSSNSMTAKKVAEYHVLRAERCVVITKKDYFDQSGLSFHYFVDAMQFAHESTNPEFKFKMTETLVKCLEEYAQSPYELSA